MSPSTRIRKCRAPQRQDSHQNLLVALRRSARLQAKQHSISIPQSHSKHRPTTSQTPHTLSDPIEAAPSRVQLQERLPYNYTYQTLKRGIGRSIEKSSEHLSIRARLTKDNLKRLENIGKSAGKRKSTSSGSQRKSSDSEIESTQSKQTVSTTDSGFQDIAFANGILDPISSKLPANLDRLEDQINQTRDMLSPSESEYRKFAYKIRTACNEQTVLLQTSQLLKEYDEADSAYSKVYNQPFDAFRKNVGFNNGLSPAQPDRVEGLNMEEFDPFPVCQQLGGAAVPSSGPYAITLPHLAGEWKGPGKDMISAQTRAAYDGASLVYGRNKARLFIGSSDPTDHAFVSSFTTDGTTLNTFAHYSSESQGQVKYHQFPTSSSLLISSYDDFRTGRRRLRNIQDDSKRSSEMLRDELNEKWSASHQNIYEEDDEEDDDYDDNQEDEEDGSSVQLLTEYYASFTKTEDGDEDFVQIPTPDASSSASKR